MLVDNNFLTCQIDWQLAASQAEVKLSQILNGNFLVINCDISNMAELPSFSPPASESTLPVFEIVLCELMDSRSINELTFGGPTLLLVDRRNMQ